MDRSCGWYTLLERNGCLSLLTLAILGASLEKTEEVYGRLANYNTAFKTAGNEELQPSTSLGGNSKLPRAVPPTIRTSVATSDIKSTDERYVVTTVLDGNKRGLPIHSIYPSLDSSFVIALDSTKSNLVKLSLPLSQSSDVELISGSLEGNSGYRNGRLDEALFDHPKKITLDDVGNIYIADTKNLAIRKIGTSGSVTTIAGSNRTGHTDGEGGGASFSSDFDVAYLRSSCSLLIADRGNRMIREIKLSQEDGRCPGAPVRKKYLAGAVALLLLSFVSGAVVARPLGSQIRSSFYWVNGGLLRLPQPTWNPFLSLPQMKQTCTTLFSAIRNVAADCITWGPALIFEVLIGIFEKMLFLALYCISLPLRQFYVWPVSTRSSPGTSMYSYTPGVSQDLLGLEQLTVSRNGCDPKPAKSLSQNRFQIPNLIGTKYGRLSSPTSTKFRAKDLQQAVSQGSSITLGDLIDLSEPTETGTDQSVPAYVELSNLAVSREVNFASDGGTNNTESNMNNMVQRCLVELASTANLKKDL